MDSSIQQQKTVKPIVIQTTSTQSPGNIAKGNPRGEQPAKRSHSEVSNTSLEELTVINEQLDELHKEVKSNKELIKNLMTKEDIQELVKSTVKSVVTELQETLLKKG